MTHASRGSHRNLLKVVPPRPERPGKHPSPFDLSRLLPCNRRQGALRNGLNRDPYRRSPFRSRRPRHRWARQFPKACRGLRRECRCPPRPFRPREHRSQ